MGQSMTVQSSGVGINQSSPNYRLDVAGTVGFDGLTGATGAGSLCLDSNKQVVYNSASDNCLSSTRATKHDINPLSLDALAHVLALQPVSFIYKATKAMAAPATASSPKTRPQSTRTSPRTTHRAR